MNPPKNHLEIMHSFYKVIPLVFLLVLNATCLHAQEYPLNQKTPQNSIYSLLYYLQEDNYNPSAAAKSFEGDRETAKQRALWFKQILDARGHYIDLEALPKDSLYTDSSNGLNRYIPVNEYKRIFLTRIKGKWLFSEQAGQEIEYQFHKVFPLGTSFLMNLLPTISEETFLGLKAWQYLGIVLLALLVFILHRLFTWLIERITRRLIQSTRVSTEFRVAIHRMAIPLSYLFLVQVIDRLFASLMLPAVLAHYVALTFKIIEPVFLTIALYRLVDVIALIMKRRAELTETTLDDQLVPLFRKTAKVFVIVFGLIYLLNNLEFNLTAIIAGASIGGLAFALAAQDTIKNMFGSLMIFIDRPFQIGDLVALEGATGTIEEVGFRSTRIRTAANSLVSVPNGKVVDMVIDNLGMRVYRRFQTNISLTYDTPVDLIETYIQGLREIVSLHPKTKKDAIDIHLNDMAASSLNILLNIYFQDEGWTEELKARHQIISEAIRLAELLNVRFAFPTQTLHVETFPDKTIPNFNYPSETKTREELLDSYLAGLKAKMIEGQKQE